jgi:hypothetical protein
VGEREFEHGKTPQMMMPSISFGIGFVEDRAEEVGPLGKSLFSCAGIIQIRFEGTLSGDFHHHP